MNGAARRGGQLVLATAISVVAYHLSALFGAFFLLPLQWVRSRLGEAAFLLSSVLALAAIVGVDAGLKALVHSPWTVLDTAVLAVPVTSLAGWVGIVLLERTRWRFLYRVLLVTAAAAAVLFPLAAALLNSESFMKMVTDAFDKVWNEIMKTPGLDASLTAGLNQGDFLDLIKQTVLYSFLTVFFLFWMFTGRLAKALEGGRSEVLKTFRVPPQGAWFLLGLWGLLLIQSLAHRWGVAWDWGFWQYVVFNLALIALVVHALAGVGIIEAFMARARWPVFGRIAVRTALLLLLFAQGAGQLVVLVGLPLLAVLELWVNLRTRTQEVGQ